MASPNYSEPKLNRSGNYELRWVEPHADPTKPMVTRTASLHTKDIKEAWRRRAELIESEKAVSQAVAPISEGKTYADIFKPYLDEHCNKEGMDTQIRIIKTRLWPFFGPLLLGSVARKDITEYVRKRRTMLHRGSPPQDPTIRRELNALVAVQNWAAKYDEWPQDVPVPKVILPADSKARENYLPAHLAQHVWDTAYRLYFAREDDPSERIYLWTLIAMAAAARSSAIEELTPARVLLDVRLIDFRNPDRRATKKRRGVVPIADRLYPVLVEAKRRAAIRGIPNDGPLLGKFSSTEKQWRHFTKRVGLPGVWRHDIRRTFATLAVQDGVPLYDVAGVLQDTLATTEKHYSHHQPDYLRNAVNARAKQAVPTPVALPFQPKIVNE